VLSPYELLKESRESWNHAVSDELVNFRNTIQVSRNVLGKVPKDYVKGNIWIEAHLTFHIQRDAYHLLALIEFEKSGAALREIRKLKNELGAMDRNPSMLVDVAQTVETPEQMGLRLRSIVRLKAFDELCCTCWNPRSVTGKASSRLGVVPIKNRKLGSIGIRRGEFSELPDGLVESRTEAIEQVSQDQRKIVRCVLDLNPNLIPETLHIFLTNEGIGFGFQESVQLTPESVKVYLRPCGLQIGFDQRRTEVSA
jgi:hypothetical protein